MRAPQQKRFRATIGTLVLLSILQDPAKTESYPLRHLCAFGSFLPELKVFEMLHVETVDLSSRGVKFPSDHVGMVIAQPYLSLSDLEPFQCLPSAKPEQLSALVKTLEIACRPTHGAEKTHFTVFPEYSIPGLDGVDVIQDTMEEDAWPVSTVVIGGVDGLSKQNFAALSSAPRTHLDVTRNGLERIPEDAWVNCKITWVKGADGAVERWLQPKISRAREEQDTQCQRMFCGSSVYTFKGPFSDGTNYRFLTLVCFDWIARIGGKKAWEWVLADLHNQASATEGDFSLSWFFVVQRNSKPSHQTFLGEVKDFFNQTTLPRIRRERACIVFANCAGKATPGRANVFGQTSLIFSSQTLFPNPKHKPCKPTFSRAGTNLRPSELLNAYYDILFRERGACIHSFRQINPGSLQSGASGRQDAIEDAAVFSLNGVADKRAPSAPVPACIKWLNDELDDLPRLSRKYAEFPLASEMEIVHDQNVAAFRQITGQSAIHCLNLACPESKEKHADEWAEPECQALENLVNTLNLVSLGSPPPTVGGSSVHATISLRGKAVDLVAIKGVTHAVCSKHAKDLIPKPSRPLIIVSRDDDNNPWSKREGSFLRTETGVLRQERKITDPAAGLIHIGYRNLLNIFQNTAAVSAVPGAIYAELAA
jgi:hypothetical protein